MALRDAITAQCGEHSDVEIVAKVVANFSGLAQRLGRDLSDLKDFAMGFSLGKATFDFVDVGHGKDCVSSKIKGTLDSLKFYGNCNSILTKRR